MTDKRLGAAADSKALRNATFGPAPILKRESTAEYELLLERLYADLKPKDIVEESYLHDVAYWTWELRRWRRMRICLIEAAIPAADVWVYEVPFQRLRDIGKIPTDFMKLANLKNQPIPPDAVEWVKSHVPGPQLLEDTVTTRAFLEQFDFVERIDREIATAENRRNVCYRELARHRASTSVDWREKIRNIEDAEFKVIRTRRHAAKRKNRKPAA